MSINFKEFPFSYRLSQSGIVFAIALGFIAAKIARQNMPPVVAIIAGSIIGANVGGSLLVSQYVIVRYPFLSLIEPADGDYFAKQISAGSRLLPLIKWFGMLMFVFMIVMISIQGIRKPIQVGVIIYSIFMLGFMIFLTFKYDPVTHPTVATYIRSTIGIGVLLFPIFIPALIVGGIRCRRLLEAQEFAAMMDVESPLSTFDARSSDR